MSKAPVFVQNEDDLKEPAAASWAPGKLEWGEVVGVVGDVQSVYPDRFTVTYQLYGLLGAFG